MNGCTHNCNQGRACDCRDTDHGRRDLCGGIFIPLAFAAVALWLGLACWLIWRVM